jgi:hypothetical protein
MKKNVISNVSSAFVGILFFMLPLLNSGAETARATQRLQPSDLEYMGAFRLPAGTSETKTWGWGGFAMTYYPDGNPDGPNDGYPGSIFGTGHAWEHQVSEISIPVPVISASKNLADLNKASTLQAFRDILNVGNLEMPRAGLAYLPKQNLQTTDKLYFCIGQHLSEEEGFMTHGWCELTLSNPQTKGNWYLDVPHNNYNTNDYLFDIPTDWAVDNTPSEILATGRYRDGGWSGQGPSFFVISPWNQGNPPPAGTSLPYITLLRYTSTLDPESWEEATNHTMDNYLHSDEWSGASWITAGNKAAVVFVGTKGTGDCWYGNPEGPCLECDNRGWWSTGFVGQFIFYDPADLAKVAAGTMQSWEPQPYAAMNIDQYLYHITASQQKEHLGAACFDRERGFLYVFEPYVDSGDEALPIIHVWKVNGGGGGTENARISLNRTRLNFGAVAAGNTPDSQSFTIENSGTGTMNWSVSDNAVWLGLSPASGTDAGVVTVTVNISGLSAGEYKGTITVTSPEASNSPQTIAVELNVYRAGSSGLPFGDYSTPSNGAAVSSSVPFTGWALDDVGVDNVKLYRGDNGSMIYIGDAVFVEGARPDVETAFPGYPQNSRAGWGYMMLTNFLPNGGNGTFTIYAVVTDKEGNQVSLGSKTITCDNAHAVKPFGAIDTPAQGGTASGTAYRNHGWVLTPQPNEIPTNGSNISVIVDGVLLGYPVYNVYRSDIAGLFPGYKNAEGAGAYFDMDTTALTNGVHTIAWFAEDNAGNIDGIGSRYFTVQNTTVPSAARPPAARGAFLKNRPPGPPEKRLPIDDGMMGIEIRETEPVNIRFPSPISHVSPLPVGSTLDAAQGVFRWLPGPGFVGNYDFVFSLREDGNIIEKNVRITIVPKFKAGATNNAK